MKIRIEAVETAVPSRALSNESLLGSVQGRISEELHASLRSLQIRNRYSSLSNPMALVSDEDYRIETSASELAIQAISGCADRIPGGAAGLFDAIGALFAVTNSQARLLPGLAPEILAGCPRLFKRTLPVMKLQSLGCSGLLKAVEAAGWYLKSHPGKKAVVVTSEVQTPYFAGAKTPNDLFSFREIKAMKLSDEESRKHRLQTERLIQTFLFGDGAVAMILSADDLESPGLGFGSIHHLTNELAIDAELLTMPEGGSSDPYLQGISRYYMHPDVPARGARYAQKTFQAVVEESGAPFRQVGEAEHLLIHTGSFKILDGVCDALGVERGAPKVRSSYDVLRDYGNLSSSSIGFMIANSELAGPTALLSFGAGFSASAGSICRFAGRPGVG